MRARSILVALAVAVAAPAGAQVQAGTQAPLFASVDENMHPSAMADFLDGTPLVFLHGSAT